MTIVELQALAVKVGSFPSGTKTSLKNKLKRSFRDHQRGSGSFIAPSLSEEIDSGIDKDSESYKRALKLMKEGL